MQTVPTTKCCRLDPFLVISQSPLHFALSSFRCCLKTHCIKNQIRFQKREFSYFCVSQVWREGSAVRLM